VKTNAFNVIVACPTLTQNAVGTTVTKYIPSSTASSKDVAVTGVGGYASTASTHSACTIAGFSLKAQPAGTAYSGTWLEIDSSNGNVKVDTNTLGTQLLKVDYTYHGVAKLTNDFTIEVKCPALSLT
jgi:hypothetical protein